VIGCGCGRPRTRDACALEGALGRPRCWPGANYGGARTKLWLFTSAGATFSTPTLAWDSGVGNWEWGNVLVS